MRNKNSDRSVMALAIVLLVLWGSMLACTLPGATPSPAATPETPEMPTSEPSLEATTAPVPAETPSPDVSFEGISFSYDGALAGRVTGEIVPAVPPGEDAPFWFIEPEHFDFIFEGYPLQGTFHSPRIFIYPVAEFEAINEAAARTFTQLRPLLAEKPADPRSIPFIPVWNAGPLMLAQVRYLDFENGSGVRFLSQYGQAASPINNNALFYAFQGLTADGRFLVGAVLPVSHPSLPADSMEYPGGDTMAFAEAFPTYVADMEQQLNAQPADSFKPALALLDALIESISVSR